MKIFHIISSLTKGGAEGIVLGICNELQLREELKIKIITFRKDNAYQFFPETLDLEVIPSKVLPSIIKNDLIDVKTLQEALMPSILFNRMLSLQYYLKGFGRSTSHSFDASDCWMS